MAIKLTEIEISNNKKLLRSTINQPYIRSENGKQILCFRYTTRTAKNQLNPNFEEYSIEYQTENIDISKLSNQFRADNSIYPGANCKRGEYKGSRWEYERGCNELAWKFVYLNSDILYGKKGLIQRAVDTYRNINKLSRSRRIIRTERQIDDGLRRIGEMDIIPYVLVDGEKVRVDIMRSSDLPKNISKANENMTFFLGRKREEVEDILESASYKYSAGIMGYEEEGETISSIVNQFYQRKCIVSKSDIENLIN